MPPVIVPHWRTIVEPEEFVDGLYHVIFTGVFAPTGACGITRGDGRVWHEEADPDSSVRCEGCVTAMTPEA
jgi:hypothetical protein